MPRFAWSFVREVLELDPDQRLRGLVFLERERSRDLGLCDGSGLVPEGILIEFCAQAAGLSLLMHRDDIDFLPVLARVNESHFHKTLCLGEKAEVLAAAVHRSKDLVEFEASIRNSRSDAPPLLECRLLLGLAPLSELPEGGEAILAHLGSLKRQIKIN